jgi:hypothetical protein
MLKFFWGLGEDATLKNQKTYQQAADISFGLLPWERLSLARERYYLHADINQILESAARSDADYLICQSLGHAVLPDFITQLSGFLRTHPDIQLVGHIIDRRDGSFYLDQQCFLVHLPSYRDLGCPPWSQLMTRVPRCERSPDNIHDDYTPLFIRRGEGHLEHLEAREENGLLYSFIESGSVVRNFPLELRVQKHFLYPYKDASFTEKLAALRTKAKEEYLELSVREKHYKDYLIRMSDAAPEQELNITRSLENFCRSVNLSRRL